MSNAKLNTCGAKTRQGHPCKHPAGYGTGHLGTGRCKFHGGLSNNQAKPGNKLAERHGFFSKHLPEETADILSDLSSHNPIDMLWDSILIQWVAIIRAQKLMHVKSQRDHTRSKVSFTDGKVIGEKWEVQHAWDKQEQFLNAQSRAITTLGQQIERYDKLCKSDLATEEQRARIDVLKAKMQLDDPSYIEDDGFLDALQGVAEDVWSDE